MRIVSTLTANPTAAVLYNEEKLKRTDPSGGQIAKVLFSTIGEKRGMQAARAIKTKNYLQSRAKYKSVHIKIAVHPQEEVSDVQFAVIARKVLKEFELHQNEFVVYRHYDKAHPHIHIVVNRISKQGKASNFSWSKIRERNLSRRFEEYLDLISAEKQRIDKRGVRQEFHYEREKLVGSKTLSWKRYLQEMILQARQNKPTEEVFLRRLARRNINMAVRPYTPRNSPTMKYGVSYAVMPGGPRFKLSAEGAYGNALAPNGLEIHDTSGRSLPNEFSTFRVKASRLGPAFQIAGHEQGIRSINQGLRSQITSNFGFKQQKDEYIDLRFLIAEESPAQSMLITALEIGDLTSVRSALELGADIAQIDKKELRYLPAQSIEFANSISEQQKQATFSFEHKLIEQYERTYDRPANALTKQLLRDVALKDWTNLAETLNLATPTIYQAADPRILMGYTDSLPSHVAMDLEGRMEQFELYAIQDDNLASKQQRDRKRNTTALDLMLQRGDENAVAALLEGNSDIDLSTVDRGHLDRVASDEVFGILSKRLNQYYKQAEPDIQFKMAIGLQDDNALVNLLDRYPALVPDSPLGWDNMPRAVQQALEVATIEKQLIDNLELKPGAIDTFKQAVEKGDKLNIVTLLKQDHQLILTIPINKVLKAFHDKEEAQAVENLYRSFREELKQLALQQFDQNLYKSAEIERGTMLSERSIIQRERSRRIDLEGDL